MSTLEFADAYQRRGHDVAIFTLVPGDLGNDSAKTSQVPVFGITDHDALHAFKADFLHVHHWPTVVTLEWLGVKAPWILGLLGRLPPLENPPPLLPGMQVPWWTLNAVGEAHFSQTPGWADSPHAIVGNWFDDHGFVRTPAVKGGPLKRLLVVSNHFPSSVYATLESIASSLDIEITSVGLPDKPGVVNADLLRQFVGVVTIGRTVLLAMAVGVPVLVLDHFGADGWVVPADVDSMAQDNYCGRRKHMEPTPDRLRYWLNNPPSNQSLREVQDWAFSNASLTQVIDRMTALGSQPCTSTPSEVFGTGSLAVGEMLNELEWIRVTAQDRESAQLRAQTHLAFHQLVPTSEELIVLWSSLVQKRAHRQI